MAVELRVVSCATCPCGRAAGVGVGGRCPFIDRQRQRGEYVYFQDEPASHVWFVKRGTVVLTRTQGDADSAERARAVRKAGSFLGLESLVRPTYIDTARVTAAATLCGASREAIDAWLGAPGTPTRVALEQMLKTVCDDVPRGASPDGNAVRRVARWLINEVPTGGAQAVPRRYTAGLLGMVPETFSRALARLAQTGAIEVTRQSLRVTNLDALRDAAGL